MKPLSASQRGLIFRIARDDLQINDDQLHEIVWRTVQVQSISKLSAAQGIQVIDALLVYRDGSKDKPRYGTATNPQISYMRSLLKALQWPEDGEQFASLIRNIAKVDSGRFLTNVLASKVIEAMKAMSSREKRNV